MGIKEIAKGVGVTALAGIAALVMACSDGKDDNQPTGPQYDIHGICKKETESTTYFHDGREEYTFVETYSDATVDGRLVRFEGWLDDDTAQVCVWTPNSPYTPPDQTRPCEWEENDGCWDCGIYNENQPIGGTESNMFVRDMTWNNICESQEILGPHGETAVVTEDEFCAIFMCCKRSGCIGSCND